MPHLSKSFGISGLLALTTTKQTGALSREDGCKWTRPLFLLLTICLFSVPALAGGFGEIHKLTASDANAGDDFGISVAISGSTALVGAHFDDDAFPGEPFCQSGSAYLFDVSDPCNPVQIAKLTASDAACGDHFGISVALSGTTALVGAVYDGDGGSQSGSAYLFDFSDPCNITETKLTASDAATSGFFGRSVAISGTTALVGANDDHAGDASGSAYLFDFSDPNNIIETKLTASDAAAWDRFGNSVAISGSTALVGAFGNDDDGINSGSAYLYDFSDPCSITETKLTASDAAAGDEFGRSVAISGNTALVGARRNNAAGSAYLFDVATGSQIAKLTASDAAADDWFGDSVALSGTTAIVGANWDDDAGTNSGSAYLYDFSDPCNITETKLTASDAAAGDEFGDSVAISGTTALVGAYGNDDAGASSGSAYLFGLCLFHPAGDINLDCKVDFRDLAVLCDQWLLELIPADVGPDGGDGFVNFFDWAIFADGWQTTHDIFDLAEFADQWLKAGSNYLIADIAPPAEGDGIVDFLDFATLASNWLR